MGTLKFSRPPRGPLIGHLLLAFPFFERRWSKLPLERSLGAVRRTQWPSISTISIHRLWSRAGGLLYPLPTPYTDSRFLELLPPQISLVLQAGGTQDTGSVPSLGLLVACAYTLWRHIHTHLLQASLTHVRSQHLPKSNVWCGVNVGVQGWRACAYTPRDTYCCTLCCWTPTTAPRQHHQRGGSLQPHRVGVYHVGGGRGE
jgi:hypothetical protein